MLLLQSGKQSLFLSTSFRVVDRVFEFRPFTFGPNGSETTFLGRLDLRRTFPRIH